jgi:cell division protein FtsW
VIAEELGLIGVIGVVGLFLVFLYLGVSTSLRAADRFSQLLAGGITAWIATSHHQHRRRDGHAAGDRS